jgi:hypothetical protein
MVGNSESQRNLARDSHYSATELLAVPAWNLRTSRRGSARPWQRRGDGTLRVYAAYLSAS